MNFPLISIIIPTYNRAHLIGETLDSVLAQTYTNWECIIVDDGSTDDTEALIQTYIQKDTRFQYFKRPKDRPKGPSACRNYGFEMSNGEYINWFDSDDLMVTDKLENDIRIILSADYDFTISQSQFFSTDQIKLKKKNWNENIWSDDAMNDFILSNIGWSVNAPLWRKKTLINEKLKFDEKLLTADDRHYHLMALGKKLKPIVFNKVSNYLRVHPDRLENFKKKSPYKIYLNYYLIKEKYHFFLNQESIYFLKKQYFSLISNLLKHKNIKLPIYYYIRNKEYEFSFREKLQLLLKIIIGIFYSVFGIGYKYL